MIIGTQDIFQNVNQIHVFEYYLRQPVKLKKFTVVSPFRSDKKPGSVSFYWRGPRLIMNDFNDRQYDIFDLVMRLNGVDLPEAVRIIAKDFGLLGSNLLSTPSTGIKIERQELIQEKEKLTYRVKKRKWKDHDLEYWGRFNINRDILDYYDVFPVREIYKRRGLNQWRRVETDEYTYVFLYREENYDISDHQVKIYRPYAERRLKWQGNTQHSIVNGLRQLPNYDKVCIITSSLKDVMVWRSIKYPSVASQGEGMFITDELLNILMSRFDKVLINYNNDKQGRKSTDKYSKKYNLPYFFTPVVSDPAEFIERFTPLQLKLLVQKHVGLQT